MDGLGLKPFRIFVILDFTTVGDAPHDGSGTLAMSLKSRVYAFSAGQVHYDHTPGNVGALARLEV